MLSSCGFNPTEKRVQNEEGLSWVTGEYQYTNEYGVYRESWTKSGDSDYAGKGYFLHDGDTSFFMQMKMFYDGKVVRMDYNVRSQNEGKNVKFALTKHDNGLYVFENPFRGFPSIMQYKFMGDTAINVVERGFEDNKDKVREFTLEKVKR
ncbi:MAG: hypothetical protein ACXVNQ_03005 [Bacteroidia bacterium]